MRITLAGEIISKTGMFEDNPSLINTNNNYSYDAEGRLIKDVQEEIEQIIWRVDGKVKEIRRPLTSEKKNLIFEYNSFGQRIAKHVYDNQTGMLEKSTYYILDAQGQQLSMYEHTADSTVNYYLAERNIYGSSRLGTTKDTVNMYNPELLPSYGVLGNRNYELNNHLGNVLAVITDVVVPLDEDTNDEVDGYQVALAMTADYSPFGVQLDGRTFEGVGYRYGYQGSERDDEAKGPGNSYTTHFRQLDPRLGRWLSIDPKANSMESPYVSMSNNPIWFNDPYGDTVKWDKTFTNAQTTEFERSTLRVTGLGTKVVNGELKIQHFDRKQYRQWKKDMRQDGSSAIQVGEWMNYEGRGKIHHVGGSRRARNTLISMVNSTEVIDVNNNFGSGNYVKGHNNTINLDFKEIHQLQGLLSPDLNQETFGSGLVFLHEAGHTSFGGSLKDDSRYEPFNSKAYYKPGPNSANINKMRRQLGRDYGIRASYNLHRAPDGNLYMPFSRKSMRELRRGRNNPADGTTPTSKYLKL